MKRIIAVASLSLPLLASAQNLLSNGSFEAGSVGTSIPSWTTFQLTPNLFPPSVIDSSPVVPFGTVVPPNPLTGVGNSPDPAGSQFAYFVDDDFAATVFQTLPFVAAGTYFVGFDYLIPGNGLVNPADATLSVCFGPCFAAVNITAASTADTWAHFGTTVTIGAGATTFSFAYVPQGSVSPQVFAKDIVIDRAFVVAVPEPTTYALFGAGLLAIGALARRRRAI